MSCRKRDRELSQSGAHRRSPHAFAARATTALLGILCLFGLGCADGAGDGAGGTGSLGIFLTDAPSDDFAAINLSLSKITLLGGPEGSVTAFEGEETLDLLNLRTVSELFATADEIPTGHYNKLRLTLTDIELVVENEDGSYETFHPKLPGNGKLDLLPRGGFIIYEGEMLALEIDIDAAKSIHIVGNGHNRFHFRPVVFVRKLERLHDGKLVRFHGRAWRIDETNETFELCHLRRPLAFLLALRRHDRPDEVTESGETAAAAASDTEASAASDTTFGASSDRHHHHFRCIGVAMRDGAYFDEAGEPVDFDAIEAGAHLTVVGRADPFRDGMTFFGEVVLLGARGTFRALRGNVASELNAEDQFDLALAPGQGYVEGSELAVQLFEQSKIYDRSGVALGRDAISLDQRAAAAGVIHLSNETLDMIKTGILILDMGAAMLEHLERSLVSVDLDSGELGIEEAASGEESCAQINERSGIYRVDVEEGEWTDIDIEELELESTIDVWGVADDASDCLTAKTVMVVAPL